MSESAILVTVAGPDHPGITAKLMTIVRSHNAKLADMGQAVTHGLLSLSFVLIEKDENNPVLKDLLFEASKMGLNLTYQKVSQKSLINGEQLEKFILNCIAVEGLTAAFLGDIATCLASQNVNILRIDNVDSRHFNVIEISTTLPKDLEIKQLKSELLKISNSHQIDVAFLKDNVFRRSKRLIVFDMDSTLIQTEVIDELAELAGAGKEVRMITEAAMNGEMDFDESLKRRVALLKGLKAERMDEIIKKLPITPGAEDFIKTVKSLGYKVALISGGFSYFADHLKEKLGLDYAFSNDLKIKDGVLTGEIEGTIINAHQKALLLKVIAQQEKISLEQVVAIGDGANDLPMLSTAGLGIAYHAKDVVKKKAEQHMSHGPMTSILYFLGIPGALDKPNKG
ncbi:MAG: phosphoserine phosphatase SerB [Bdellovibrio sp. CG12_big_fil_rev_8_21_14_0_65_39_13]|nr:MAG: phosphoserine phosphatase SerB [Bdellovibrio sp. CG22_combo_CG10-13_8_21_14_all_39_27]PIQ59087.1 MAG: phosphoserine phosphatase SerB [Bdellovibrio sp. CG12_big_fil_rev_8_21_14_0_65_39_13]PIR33598.1 MAG: phosphoserine phosphatase SerB [Bdellovibrio sp. CG11_big_fil_rev_8_21_14_0_20_39_38]